MPGPVMPERLEAKLSKQSRKAGGSAVCPVWAVPDTASSPWSPRAPGAQVSSGSGRPSEAVFPSQLGTPGSCRPCHMLWHCSGTTSRLCAPRCLRELHFADFSEPKQSQMYHTFSLGSYSRRELDKWGETSPESEVGTCGLGKAGPGLKLLCNQDPERPKHHRESNAVGMSVCHHVPPLGWHCQPLLGSVW